MTANDVQALKDNWLQDPCWDIYETEGFEAHRAELKAFQSEQEARWEDNRRNQIAAIARRLNCSPETAQYIDYLEGRIAALEGK